jgi:hypothetical protein
MKQIGVFLLAGIGVLGSFISSAQGISETALLFSQTSSSGSARMQGMGGVQVSLGGDFSSAGSNPAGLGMFNRSEFTISPSYSINSVQATHFSNTVSQSKSNLSIPSLSFAFHNEKNQGKWISGTFVISLSRLNDFNSNTTYQGVNAHNSIVDYLSVDSDGLFPEDFQESGDYYNTLNRLAYNTYLIDTLWNQQGNYYNYISPVGILIDDPSDVPRMTQKESIVTSGGQNQWSASYGINIDDKIFLGAGVHLRTIRFESKKTYMESDFYFVKAPNYNPLNSLSLEESLKISGSGYSATIGAIVRPVDGLQIGLAFNTPTMYTLSDVYSAKMTADWNNFDYYGNGQIVLDGEEKDEMPELLSDYRLKTPGRITGGATYFFGKSGFVSAEVDAINYAGSKYTSKSEGLSVEEDNAIIKNLYQSSLNIRVGGEYRLNNYRFRGGLGRQGDPFTEKQNGISRTNLNYSLGLGYRTDKFYIDAALMLKTGKNSYRPYSVDSGFSPLVTMNNQATSFLFTVGFPF